MKHRLSTIYRNKKPLEVNSVDHLQISPALTDWINCHAFWPFQELAYLELYAKTALVKSRIQHIFVMQAQEIVAYFAFECIPDSEKSIVLLGTSPLLHKQTITGYTAGVYAPNIAKDADKVCAILLAVAQHFYKQKTRRLTFDYVENNSPMYQAFTNITSKPRQPVMHVLSTNQGDADYIDLKTHNEQMYRQQLEKLATVKHSFTYDLELTKENFNEFVRLHKLSDSNKPKFMNPKMEALFKQITKLPFQNWQLRLAFLKLFGENAAVLLYFRNDSQILIYSSGYDTNFNYYTPVVTAIALLIKTAKQLDCSKVEFLLDTKCYGKDLGATTNKLHRIEITIN